MLSLERGRSRDTRLDSWNQVPDHRLGPLPYRPDRPNTTGRFPVRGEAPAQDNRVGPYARAPRVSLQHRPRLYTPTPQPWERAQPLTQRAVHEALQCCNRIRTLAG